MHSLLAYLVYNNRKYDLGMSNGIQRKTISRFRITDDFDSKKFKGVLLGRLLSFV